MSRHARIRFEEAVVGVLATLNLDGSPNLVPITFAVVQNTLLTGIDHKPKRTSALRRLVNIRNDPRVSVLVQHYSSDWATLWWARVEGTATIIEPQDERHKVAARPLAERYPEYRDRPIRGHIIEIDIERWTEWSA